MIEKIVKLVFKLILIYLIGLVLFNIYKYWPYNTERNKEAEAYFMQQLHTQMGDADSLDTNLSNFTMFEWDTFCILYDINGTLDDMFFIKKGFIRDAKRDDLDLSKFIRLDKSDIVNIPRKPHIKDKNIIPVSTSCIHKEFLMSNIRRVTNNPNQYILDIIHGFKQRREYKERLKNKGEYHE